MGEESERPPQGVGAKRAGSAREERLAQALRANLRRRKDQTRGRTIAGHPSDTTQDETR